MSNSHNFVSYNSLLECSTILVQELIVDRQIETHARSQCSSMSEMRTGLLVANWLCLHRHRRQAQCAPGSV